MWPNQPRRQPPPDRRAEEHVALGDAHRVAGDGERAAAEYRAALAVDPVSVPARIGLSVLRMPGDDYFVWLQRFHAALKPATYLEIGVATGRSLALARPPTRAIGVDPVSRVSSALTAETHLFAETSDEFFARRNLAPLLDGEPLALAFIDGGHLFEQALKDFINTERQCGPRSVVLMHDTVPLDEPSQSRSGGTGFYSGDVWKAILCLKHYRPDLDIITVATPWTGLTVVTGLNPATRVAPAAFDEMVARFIDTPYSAVANDSGGALNMVPNDWRQVEARLHARGIL